MGVHETCRLKGICFEEYVQGYLTGKAPEIETVTINYKNIDMTCK